MITWNQINAEWAKLAGFSDPTLGDALADQYLRNPEVEAPVIQDAIAHMKLVNDHSSNALEAMELTYAYEAAGWRRGNEAVFQARVLQQIATYYHLKQPDPLRFADVVVRHTFAVTYAYATPHYVPSGDIHFIIVPFVYLEFVHFVSQAFANCLAPNNSAQAWANIAKSVATDAPCPPVMRKLLARLITYHAFDPLDPGDNMVYRLSQQSEWFGTAGEGENPSPLETHLGYSAVDFALSHELGHRFFHGVNCKAAGADEEACADEMGFNLYSSSWGWRADILESAPFGDIGAILLGPIWFFYTAGLMFQMKKALKKRYDALGMSLDDFDEPTADGHLDAIAARWENQRQLQSGYLTCIFERGGSISQDEADRLTQFIERCEDFRALCLRWIGEIPENDIRFAASLS